MAVAVPTAKSVVSQNKPVELEYNLFAVTVGLLTWSVIFIEVPVASSDTLSPPVELAANIVAALAALVSSEEVIECVCDPTKENG